MTSQTLTVHPKSGVVARFDRGIDGLLCFNPQPGLLYAVPKTDAEQVRKWLSGKAPSPPDESYRTTLGVGWSNDISKATYPIPQLLRTATDWPVVPAPERPLLINWFITGRCPLACAYCYAEDLMRNDALEPKPADIVRISDAILSFAPVVVVLTGGDPLFTSNLGKAIECLHGRCAIVVDTSGYTLREEHIKLFASKGISVRLSIDSHVPRIHDAQRPRSTIYPGLDNHGSSMNRAMDALCRCLEAGIGVTVQTVATKKTANDLVAFGDILFRLGVHSWRIFKVAPSAARMAGYRQLVGSHTDDGRPYKGKIAQGPYSHAFERVLAAREAHWKGQMAIQVTMNDIPNSVVIVTPDGRFVTESNTGSGKVEVDPVNPRRPRLSALRSVVDMSGHAARYLNLTSFALAQRLRARERVHADED